MRRFSYGTLLTFVAAALLALPAQAQEDLSGALGSIGQQYADNYTQPITDALGAGLNSGLFRTAEVGGGGILPMVDVYVGVAAMGAFTSRSTFQPENERIEVTTDRGTATGTIRYPDEVPTAFGSNEAPPDAIIDYDDPRLDDENVPLPSGLINTSIAPLAVPQLGVGSFFGTDAQLRFLPETSISDYGSVGLFGLSVRHSLSQYIPLSPVSLAVQGTFQSLSLSGQEQDDVVDASGWALNAQVSKSVPVAPITFYGGLQYEQFGVDIDYTFQTNAGSSRIQFEQDAQNSVRALAGVSVTLALMQVNVDYALGANNVVTAGLGVTL